MDKGNDARHPRWIRARSVKPLPPERLERAKKAFTTRRVPFETTCSELDVPTAKLSSRLLSSSSSESRDLTLVSGPVRPRSGDLVLATVTRIGHHRRIELANGRRSHLHIGDEIVVTYADRYAPDQFESHVPMDLAPTHLVASGGIASTSLSRHERVRRPTEIAPIGLIGDAVGSPLNISQTALEPPETVRQRPRTLAVIGSSMNSGKTTTVGSIILGLQRAGRKPGATKVTGTGSGADYWVMVDAGAHCVVDFTDVGLASTFRIPHDVVEANFVRLVDHLTNVGCSEIIIEIADGVFQQETAELIQSEVFRDYVDAVVFAGADAMGAVAGVEHLRSLGLPLVALSGAFTRSPLGIREVEVQADLRVLSRDDLASPAVATELLSSDHVVDLRPVPEPIQISDAISAPSRPPTPLSSRRSREDGAAAVVVDAAAQFEA